MRRQTFTRQDVYVDDDLRWSGAAVTTTGSAMLVVKVRTEGEVLRATEVVDHGSAKTGRREIKRTYTGIVEGETVGISLLGRDCGCGR